MRPRNCRYTLQTADILSLRSVAVLSPLAGLFNLQLPASSASSGLCPWVMTVEGKLLASWALPLLTVVGFVAAWPLLRRVFASRQMFSHLSFTAAFVALILFVFSSLTSTTAALVQVRLAVVLSSELLHFSVDQSRLTT